MQGAAEGAQQHAQGIGEKIGQKLHEARAAVSPKRAAVAALSGRRAAAWQHAHPLRRARLTHARTGQGAPHGPEVREGWAALKADVSVGERTLVAPVMTSSCNTNTPQRVSATKRLLSRAPGAGRRRAASWRAARLRPKKGLLLPSTATACARTSPLAQRPNDRSACRSGAVRGGRKILTIGRRPASVPLPSVSRLRILRAWFAQVRAVFGNGQ